MSTEALGGQSDGVNLIDKHPPATDQISDASLITPEIFGSMYDKALSSMCLDHDAILKAAANNAIYSQLSIAEAMRHLNTKLTEFMGCTACHSVSPDTYNNQDKRFCARCQTIVSYSHKCSPKLQYN